MKTLLAILKIIWQIFFPPAPPPLKPVNIGLPSLPTNPVDGSLDVAIIAGELGITAAQVLNSPEMIAGRYSVEVQKVKDAIQLHNQQAMKTGNGDAVNADLTP